MATGRLRSRREPGVTGRPIWAIWVCPSACDPPGTRTIITVMLSGPPRRFARSTRKRAASSGGSTLTTAPISCGVTTPGQPVAAQQEHVARPDGVRPLDVHLDLGVRAERADDDVLLEVAEFVRVHALAAGDLPDPGVVEGELLGDAVADAVGPAVADVADPGPFGPQDQGGAGGAHAAELGVLLADGVDAGVGLAGTPGGARG